MLVQLDVLYAQPGHSQTTRPTLVILALQAHSINSLRQIRVNHVQKDLILHLDPPDEFSAV
jgi:hypothetical protein